MICLEVLNRDCRKPVLSKFTEVTLQDTDAFETNVFKVLQYWQIKLKI